MPSDVESSVSSHPNSPAERNGQSPSNGNWIRVGAIAAASAVLGGLAAAWFYRKALSQLQEAQHEIPDSGSSTIGDGSPEDF